MAATVVLVRDDGALVFRHLQPRLVGRMTSLVSLGLNDLYFGKFSVETREFSERAVDIHSR